MYERQRPDSALPLRRRNEERGILLDVRNGGALESPHTVQISQGQQLDAVGIGYLQAILANLFQFLK